MWKSQWPVKFIAVLAIKANAGHLFLLFFCLSLFFFFFDPEYAGGRTGEVLSAGVNIRKGGILKRSDT